ncbi:hypothetical protein WDU94_003007 [Cyamophila willieti]
MDVVLTKVDLPAANVYDILRSEEDYKHLAEKLIKLQCTGFLCINNLVSCMSISPDTLFVHFVNMLSHHYADDLTGEQVESLTCALRSLVLGLNQALQDQGKVGQVGSNPGEALDLLSKRLVEKLTGEQEVIKQENGTLVKNGGGSGKKVKKEADGVEKKE